MVVPQPPRSKRLRNNAYLQDVAEGGGWRRFSQGQAGLELKKRACSCCQATANDSLDYRIGAGRMREGADKNEVIHKESAHVFGGDVERLDDAHVAEREMVSLGVQGDGNGGNVA
jgi:hypothetical protein